MALHDCGRAVGTTGDGPQGSWLDIDTRDFLHNHMVVHELNLTFLALSDPTRRVILDRLRNGTATVNELAEPFGISQQAVSKHLAYLERARLIEKRREGRAQLCSLRADSLKEAHEWIDSYRQFWGEAFDQLNVLLKDLKRKQQKRRRGHGRKSR
jgi:DNA-binding transcriptional ArsR family regulator